MGLKRNLTVVPGSHIPGSGIPVFLSLKDEPAHSYKQGFCLRASLTRSALGPFRLTRISSPGRSAARTRIEDLGKSSPAPTCALSSFAARMPHGTGAIHLALVLIAIQVVKFACSSATHLGEPSSCLCSLRSTQRKPICVTDQGLDASSRFSQRSGLVSWLRSALSVQQRSAIAPGALHHREEASCKPLRASGCVRFAPWCTHRTVLFYVPG